MKRFSYTKKRIWDNYDQKEISYTVLIKYVQCRINLHLEQIQKKDKIIVLNSTNEEVSLKSIFRIANMINMIEREVYQITWK